MAFWAMDRQLLFFFSSSFSPATSVSLLGSETAATGLWTALLWALRTPTFTRLAPGAENAIFDMTRSARMRTEREGRQATCTDEAPTVYAKA